MKRLLTWVCSILVLTVTTARAEDVDYRLPEAVKPTFQQIHLNIDPDKPDYTGSTVINVDVTSPVQKVGFYEMDIQVTNAELRQGNRIYPLRIIEGEYNINWGHSTAIVPVGQYELAIDFEGKVNTSSDGMYLSSFEGRNYIFTQFEDMHARKAFPSFDEPSFKIPYQMTITTPESQVVASNTPVESRTVDDGMQTVKFMKTKPMPTYLIAYTVGPFDSVEMTGLSVPGKLYVPKGYADKTKFIVKHTPEILDALEDFFGIDYPYKKLDFVAVPNFTHGAMENAGLITYRDSLLLLEDNPGLAERSAPLNVVAHELAHQWYGNLVTMAWWDDLWLNEAFASWMASYVVMELYPELNYKDRIIQEGAFGADASPTVKPIKKVVKSQPDVMDGLGLNYSKGESILQMIEALIGTDNFRKGVQAYMQEHAWGNTQADDLWAALDKVSDINLSAMMKAYLEQPGYPLIKIAGDGTVSQQRFHLAGADVKEQTWAVPLNISYKKDGKIQREIVFVNKASTRLPQLAEADWVFPNDNATGYFRWDIPTTQMDNLLADLDALNTREKKNVLYNAQALLNAGEVGIATVMKVLNALAEDDDLAVVRAAVTTLAEFDYLVDDQNEAYFAKLLDEKFLPLLDKLTLTQSDDDDQSVISLRNQLYGLMGQYSEDKTLKAKSKSLAEKYLKDTSSVPNSIARTSLSLMTKGDNADPAWFDRIMKVFADSKLPNVKNTLLYSMRYTQPDMVNKLLDLSLTDKVTPANTIRMLSAVAKTQEDQSIVYKWLSENADAVIEKMPDYHVSRMPEFVSATCSADNLTKAIAFYGPLKDKYEGMARSYEIMMDEANQCLRLKSTYEEEFDAYLSSL